MAASVKITVFCDIAPYTLVEVVQIIANHIHTQLQILVQIKIT
jgi:hypothetical protein